MVWKTTTRCYYEDNCRRANCHFVHPSDPEWDTAKPARYGPNAERERFPRQRSPSPRRERTPERDQRPNRRYSIHDDHGDTHMRRRSPDPEHRTHHRNTSSTQIPAPSAGTSAAAQSRSDMPLTSGRHHASRQNSISMPPPPTSAPPPPSSMPPRPPPGPAPLPPPQPLPAVPTGLKLEQAPAVPEMSVEEKNKLWGERIKLLSESAKAHEHLRTVDEEYKSALAVTRSALFDNLRQEDQKKLKSQLATLAANREQAKASYEEIRKRILSTASWPIAPLHISPEDQEKNADLVKFVKELSENVSQMKDLLGDITVTYKKPPEPPLFLADESDDEDNMEVDVQPGSSKKAAALPSRKRRRTDNNADDIGTKEITGADLPTPEELVNFREQMARFEHQLSVLRNDILVFGNQRKEETESYIEATIEEIEGARLREQRARDQAQREEVEGINTNITKLEKSLADANNDVDELTTTTVSNITEVDRLKEQLAEEKLKHEASLQRLLRVEERLQGYATTQQANAYSMETLQAALKSYTTRPPSPPMSPVPIAPPYLLESIRQPLVDALREEVKPLIEQMRANVEQLVEEKNRGVFESSWLRIKETLDMLHAIHRKINEVNVQSSSSSVNPS